MNAPTRPSRPDLDAEIARAERAVAERDGRAGGKGRLLMRELRRKSRLGARLLGGTAAGAFVLGWVMARGRRRRLGEDDPRGGRRPPRDAGARLIDAPWATLVPLLWPLLPVRLRERVSPGMASFLTGIGLPLVARRMSKQAHEKAVEQRQQERGARAERRDDGALH
jgi:hypothetical protein